MNFMGLVDRLFIKKPVLRSLVTRVIYGSKDVEIDMLGSRVFVNRLRENGYFRAYRKTLTSSLLRDELPVMLSLGHFAKEGGAFIDAGANVGIYSAYFSRFSEFFSSFDVHAFEPAPTTFRRLELNASRLGFHAHNYALGAREEKLQFVEGAVSHVATLRSRQNIYSLDGIGFEVDAIPLHKIDIDSKDIILKIDVEGQELEVLQGAEPFFVEKRVCAVYCDGWDSPDVISFLEQYNFSFYDGRTLKKSTAPPWCLLAVPRDRQLFSSPAM